MLFKEGAKLQIAVLSDLIFLTPDYTRSNAGLSLDSQPRTDTSVEGTVTLSLPTAKKLSRLLVQLNGRQQVLAQGASSGSASDTLKLQVEIDIGTGFLGPGDHTFAWTFVVPASTAPYEICPYGRTFHKIVATAPGLGRFGNDLIQELDITLMGTHTDVSGLPPGFSLVRNHKDKDLGQVAIELFSPFLLISGLLRFDLFISRMQSTIKLQDIVIKLVQQYNLQRSSSDSAPSIISPYMTPLWSLRRDKQAQILLGNDSLHIVRDVELPNEYILRPTTPSDSLTGIRVVHQMIVSIIYKSTEEGGKERKEHKISTGVTLSSCGCKLEALQLPAYSGISDSTPQTPVSAAQTFRKCLCSMTANEVRDLYDEWLPRNSGIVSADKNTAENKV